MTKILMTGPTGNVGKHVVSLLAEMGRDVCALVRDTRKALLPEGVDVAYRVRQHIGSGSPLEPTIGFSRAVRDGHLVFVSATAAIWPDGHVDPEVGVQARRCLEIIGEALRESGATLGDVVRTRVFLVDAAHGDAVAQVHGEVFGEIRPATGFIVVQGFLDPRWLVEIEADAVVGR
jgi:enamine deaminase RidA (YjgF/YER057c/UK114 family)